VDLRDYWNDAGSNDALIGGQKAKVSDAGGGDNRPVCRIGQGSAEGGDLGGYVRGERNNLKDGVGLDLTEKIADRHLTSGAASAEEKRDFE
jgi:hypothetical protein